MLIFPVVFYSLLISTLIFSCFLPFPLGLASSSSSSCEVRLFICYFETFSPLQRGTMNDGLMVKSQGSEGACPSRHPRMMVSQKARRGPGRRSWSSTARSIPRWLWLPNGATWWWSCCRSHRTPGVMLLGAGQQQGPGHLGPWNLLPSGLRAWARDTRAEASPSPASPPASLRAEQGCWGRRVGLQQRRHLQPLS